MNETHIFIDGLNVFMRHFAANPSRSLNGNLCGAIYGTLNSIKNLSQRFTPDKITIVWEGGGSARRRAIDPKYKEGRRPVLMNRSSYYAENGIVDTVEDRNSQLKVLIEILNNTQINQIYVGDCEADDVIAYLCKTKKSKQSKIIVTSDKDFYQLIDDQTKIWSPNKKLLIDEDYVLEKWHVLSDNFCTVRCFAGDQSDGIKGVKGAGFKMMAKKFPRLKIYKNISIDNIINETKQKINEGSKLKLYDNIINSYNELKKNWKLMYLDSSMLSADQIKKINYQFALESEPNKMNTIRILNREGLNSFDIHNFFLSIKSNLRKVNERI